MPERLRESSGSWIFDTVVLSNFLLTGTEDILIKRYRDKGILTYEVYTEIDLGIAKGYDLSRIDSFITQSKCKIITLNRTERIFFTKLLNNLDIGEASCVTAAKGRNAVVVTDDRKARNACKEYDIPFTGTIGILKASCQDKLISTETADSILKRMIDIGFCSPVNSISDIIH